jgi:hypothetical protein
VPRPKFLDASMTVLEADYRMLINRRFQNVR